MDYLKRTALCVAILSFTILANAATNLDAVGVTLLRAIDPTLTGNGVPVAQAEAAVNDEGNAWEVNPFAIGKPTNLFTYLSIDGSSSNYPNALGIESGHANGVGANFYGNATGVAPDVSHVDNYEATYFYQSKIAVSSSIAAKIVNQSFIFGSNPPQTTVDLLYDNYAAQNNVLFVSGVGNAGPPSAPATCYNGIGVGAFGGGSSVGPTIEITPGRSKPDITAPADVTSFSTPLVAGAAAILRQAGLRGDGGSGTAGSSTDIRTIKALLLNGAIKPSNWTHSDSAPLDTRYGAGVLNVFNSYEQLIAGKFPFTESTANSFPTANTNNVPSLAGWDFNSISSSIQQDKVNHYYFKLPTNGAKAFTLTATLVWNRQANKTSINNLDFFLYNASNSNLVAASTSTVDNVEHIYLPQLPAGRYDLQVFKKGGLGTASNSETYALAFEIFSMPLNIEKSGMNVVISWPIAPTGFRLQTTSNLNPPISWSDVATAPVMTDHQNQVILGATAFQQYFRLIRP